MKNTLKLLRTAIATGEVGITLSVTPTAAQWRRVVWMGRVFMHLIISQVVGAHRQSIVTV